MTLDNLTKRVQKYTNDKTSSIFTKNDIEDFINEAIDRCKASVYFADMVKLQTLTQHPILLPSHYHYLLAIYAAARCFEMDEQHYQATQRMNEFEYKFEDLVQKIDNGDVKVVDGEGKEIEHINTTDYVRDVYFNKGNIDFDEGVEGV